MAANTRIQEVSFFPNMTCKSEIQESLGTYASERTLPSASDPSKLSDRLDLFPSQIAHLLICIA